MKKIIALVLALAMCLALGSTLAETAEAVDWFGTVDGSVYENATAGFGCNLDGWTYLSKEEIAQQTAMSLEMMNEDLAELVKTVPSVTVMIANSADSMRNVNISIQDISANKAVYETFTLDQILELSKDTVVSGYQMQGMTDITCEVATFEISGETFYGMQTSCKYMGIQVYQKQLAVIKDDNMITITISTYVTDATDEVLACFYTIK